MIKINIEKAKNIAHEIRRAKRAEEFAPYDEVIMKQIPGNDSQVAEAARQSIREKYQEIQIEIDSSNSVDHLKTIVDNLK